MRGIRRRGRLPALGSDARVGFKGVLPYEEKPGFPRAAIERGNTNNKTVDRRSPVSASWGERSASRWLTLMKAREVHTRESFIEAQLTR